MLVLVLAWPGVTAARSLTVGITGEAGPELDTNANRIQPIVIPCPPGEACLNGVCEGSGDSCLVDPEDPVVAGLFRVTGTGSIQLRLGKHALTAAYGGGGKLFLDDAARGADEVVHRASGGWAALLPSSVLSLEGTYYDAYQRSSQRDFRTGSGLARMSLGRRAEGLSVSGAVGYRGLQYKPLDDYSFRGPVAGLELESALTRETAVEVVDWSFSLSYWLGVREFTGTAEGPPLPCAGRPQDLCNQPSETGRQDLNHVLHAGVDYLGNAEAGIWYSLEVNQSNSHGETFTRQVVGLKFTTGLGAGLFLTTKGVLQFSRFRDPYLISRIRTESFTEAISIEDENRSRIIVQLARELTSRISLDLRYALYVGESVTQAVESRAAQVPGFLRQTVFLGLRMEYSWTT